MNVGEEAVPPTGEQGHQHSQEKQAAAPRAFEALPYDPSIRPGSVDVTGTIPDDVQVDPEITEGHTGYDESGSSEVNPGRPLSSRDANNT
jgi:hypothetical protein